MLVVSLVSLCTALVYRTFGLILKVNRCPHLACFLVFTISPAVCSFPEVEAKEGVRVVVRYHTHIASQRRCHPSWRAPVE